LAPTLVLAGRAAPGRARLEALGARVLALPVRRGGVDLARGLEALGEVGITDLLVEGGGRLAAALLRAGLVDELHWIQAPILLGGDARPALGDLGLAKLSDAIHLRDARWRRLGPDAHLTARLEGPVR
jgi:diaminohydroxyphosphoribosylaminopyrimidine deaminase/5-amino-6-(5-phosphoribosylamino)uracil reductase